MKAEPSPDVVVSVATHISTVFDVHVHSELTTLEAIRTALLPHIIRLLSSNPEKLMALLYRIDVQEQRVNAIFSRALPPDVPELLADLIIERQLAKAITRKQARDML